MKVFEKYLVYGKSEITGKEWLACSGFSTKKEAIERLNECFKRLEENLWCDSQNHKFYIKKNKVEYK